MNLQEKLQFLRKSNGNQNLSLNASVEQVENLIRSEYPELTERFIEYIKKILMMQ